MLSLVVSRSARLTVPFILFAASIFIGLESAGFNANWLVAATTVIPLILFLVAVLLSLKFNNSRYVILSLIVGLAYSFSQGYVPSIDLDYLLAGYAILSINLFALSFCRDRSIFSIHGSHKLIALGLQGFLAWSFIEYYPELFAQLVFIDFIHLPLALKSQFSSPDFLLLIFLAVLAGHAVFSIKTNSSIQATFFGCQLALLLILSETSIPNIDALAASFGFLAVILYIILNSHDMAYRDELTKLPSRRGLNQLLLSPGRNYVIAMIDIDHFKKFNDTHGHDIGDEVLKLVAAKIGGVTGGGKPFRYGGEEFTVVFPGKTIEQVEAHLDSLRNMIENYVMVVRDSRRQKKASKSEEKKRVAKSKNNTEYKKLSVTISIGFARRSGDDNTPEQVIKAADEALYRAKGKGRNCISV